MGPTNKLTLLLICLGLTTPFGVVAKNATTTISVNKKHVNTWNQFAERIYILHQHQLSQHPTYTRESKGGYMGNEEFYREVKHFDKKSGRLLSRVLWEIENPDQIHEIEVFVYDNNGRLKRDYLAAFLPGHRNTPVQTLINFHYQNDELKSFRQFDASGEKIYERCQGKFFGAPVEIALTDTDFAAYDSQTAKLMESEEYLSCFQNTIAALGEYNNPLHGIELSPALMKKAQVDVTETADAVERQIQTLTAQLAKTPSAKQYYERGSAYLKLRVFDKAADDFTQAIKLDDSLDDAYLGRGLAHGRLRMFDEAIDDLTVFIDRNPNNSHAYTKRGVRRIWAGDYENAEKDLKKAIALDANNAEARDDLGVMYARKKEFKKALEQFTRVVEIDPSYSKGFHNLAMTHHILGNYDQSLMSINKSLELLPNDKNALLLKGETLLKLGRREEAEAIMDRAEFLPEGGWQERFSLQ